jgi:hypothetical protein
MDAEGTLKRWDGTASQDVGSGGVGSVDIMFADTFDATNISEYTTTGTVAVTDNVLEVIQGKKSLKITHTGGASAERIIPVDIKFRNKNVTFSFDVESDALSGNLTLTVTDNTNTVTLINAESIQPQGTLDTSIKRSVSFIIPDDCEELKYKFNAVSESGKISIIDNVVIELTQTAKMSTTIEVPKKEYALLKTVGTFSNSAGVDTLVPFTSISSSSGLYSIAANGTSIQYNGSYLIKLKGETGANGELVTFKIEVNGVKTSGLTQHHVDNNASGSNSHFEDSFILDLKSGDVVKAYILNPNVRTNRSFELHIEQINSDQETQEVSLAQAVLKQESDSVFNGRGFIGQGSTNTGVVRLSSDISNFGDALTYVPSATNGDSWIVNKSGVYNFHASLDMTGTTATSYYFTKNATLLTVAGSASHSLDTVVSNIGYANTANDVPQISGSALCNIGDTIRFHTNVTGAQQTNNNNYDKLIITYQGSLKQVNVTENQKIEIPTSELRMEGASTRGTGAETFTAKFTNLAKLRGDAFSLDNSNATIVTMKKKGRLNVSASIRTNTSAASITKNQAVNTAAPLASERMATALVSTATAGIMSMHACFDVNVGDVIRVNAEATPTADTGNSLNLSFQEQEIAVSVTNVLPQFSESDSSIRVDTANGYGSPTGTRIRRFSNVRDYLGSAITYVPSDVNGDSFRINESGTYHVSYDDDTGTTNFIGLSKNASNLTTAIHLLPSSEILATSANSGSTFSENVSWSGYLQAGDVIRAQTSGGSGNASLARLTISKVGKPNVTGVDVTPFAAIEYEVSQFASMNYLTTLTSGTSNNIRYVVNNNTNNGLISIVDNGVNTVFTALKPCKIDFATTLVLGSTGNLLRISKNGSFVEGAAENNANMDYGQTTYIDNLNTGDYFIVQTTTSLRLSSGHFRLRATELRDAYQVIGGGVENTYSAVITSAAAITSQSYPFIASVTKGGTGIYNVNFVSGFFTSAPFCSAAFGQVATGVISNSGVIQATDITTSGCIVRTFNTSFSPLDLPFTLKAERQGSDYRTPSKAIGLPQQRIAVLKDVKANNVSGGSASTTYTARVVNTLQDPTGIVANAASFTGTGGTNTSVILGAGTYKLTAKAPANGTSDAGTSNGGRSRIRLYNATDASVIALGQLSQPCGGLGGALSSMDSADLECYFTLTAQKTLEIQQRFTTTTASGLGTAANFGEDEHYTVVSIEKIEE